MKKMFSVSTKTIVATGIGAALFTLLFMFVKVPTGIPEVSLQTAYAVGGFFAALFGPIAGGLIAFIGHLLSDAVQYGSPWMSWVIASGVACFITGLCHVKLNVEEGIFTVKDAVIFNVFQIIGNVVAWIVVAPVLDIVIYAEPANKVFAQGAWAFLGNIIIAGILGTLIAVGYSKIGAKSSSLTKENE